MRPVLIVGAGAAGLTLARRLAQAGRPVRVFDHPAGRVDRGIGLWGRAHVALRRLGLAPLLDGAARVPSAAYRARDGAWLSECSPTAANRGRVTALREAPLLAALEAALPRGSVDRSSPVVAALADGGGAAVRLADGTAVDGACVVGADGVASTVRAALPGAPAALDAGQVVHSGLLPPSAPGLADLFERREELAARPGAPAPFYAFETLSSGRRFACVPLADGGAFWFATRPAAPGGAADGTGRAAVAALLADYAGWHAPIPQVLAAAVAAAERDAADGARTAALRSERVLVAPPLDRWAAGRAVVVGDAAHGLPINLAQGAAAAVEGGYLLGEALARLPAAAWDDGAALARAFDEYQTAHEPRVRACGAVTAFTDALARPRGGAAELLRNTMRLVPQPLNGWVFDAALSVSLGDWPPSTRANWPLPTHAPRVEAAP